VCGAADATEDGRADGAGVLVGAVRVCISDEHLWCMWRRTASWARRMWAKLLVATRLETRTKESNADASGRADTLARNESNRYEQYRPDLAHGPGAEQEHLC
jgi:hypothetical protein